MNVAPKMCEKRELYLLRPWSRSGSSLLKRVPQAQRAAAELAPSVLFMYFDFCKTEELIGVGERERASNVQRGDGVQKYVLPQQCDSDDASHNNAPH